jgi:hypothetical protein
MIFAPTVEQKLILSSRYAQSKEGASSNNEKYFSSGATILTTHFIKGAN